jgi:hypothetical protein
MPGVSPGFGTKPEVPLGVPRASQCNRLWLGCRGYLTFSATYCGYLRSLQGQSQARVGCAARSRQGSLEWVSEQRAHSIGLAAAAVLVQVHIGGKTHTE